MSDYVCPLCCVHYDNDDYTHGRRFNSEICRHDYDFRAVEGYTYCFCEHYDVSYAIENAIAEGNYDQELTERLLVLAVQVIIQSQYCNVDGKQRKWHFFYDPLKADKGEFPPEFVNLALPIREYPEHIMDKAHRALLSLAVRYPNYGDIIYPFPADRRIVFEHKMNNIGRSGIHRILEDLGYLKDPKQDDGYSITALGWQKIDDLKKQEQVVRQGFIAMAFREETKPIREAFRKAITEMGYNASVIDEKEHNNQIVPEIFYEIQRSKFVVVDVTYPNLGAYYEAGYAQALGKQVIICCQEDSFKDSSRRPHFDISQKSMIVWTDEADLVRRLKRRIEATVQ